MLTKIMPEMPSDDVAAAVAHYRDVLGFNINYEQADIGVMDRERDHVRPTTVVGGVKPMRIGIFAALLCSLTAVHSPAIAQASSTSDPMPSITLPAELDRVLRDYERAWQSGDASSVAALFAVDGFVLQNGRSPVRGRDAIAKAYAGQAGGELRLRAFAYAAADTVGYIIGAYGYGNSQTDSGKYTVTLRRQRGGRWEIFSDMDNGNQPRRQAPAASSPPVP